MPPRLLQVAKIFHEGMHAEVRVGHSATESFKVQNVLR